jgi:hypothetical protein
MPTKKRRARRPNVPLYTGPVPLEARPEPNRPQNAPGDSLPAARPSLQSAPGLSRTDYTYVVNDLKRIAVIGGGLIAALVALSFFIR